MLPPTHRMLLATCLHTGVHVSPKQPQRQYLPKECPHRNSSKSSKSLVRSYDLQETLPQPDFALMQIVRILRQRRCTFPGQMPYLSPEFEALLYAVHASKATRHVHLLYTSPTNYKWNGWIHPPSTQTWRQQFGSSTSNPAQSESIPASESESKSEHVTCTSLGHGFPHVSVLVRIVHEFDTNVHRSTQCVFQGKDSYRFISPQRILCQAGESRVTLT